MRPLILTLVLLLLTTTTSAQINEPQWSGVVQVSEYEGVVWMTVATEGIGLLPVGTHLYESLAEINGERQWILPVGLGWRIAMNQQQNSKLTRLYEVWKFVEARRKARWAERSSNQK